MVRRELSRIEAVDDPSTSAFGTVEGLHPEIEDLVRFRFVTQDGVGGTGDGIEGIAV